MAKIRSFSELYCLVVSYATMPTIWCQPKGKQERKEKKGIKSSRRKAKAKANKDIVMYNKKFIFIQMPQNIQATTDKMSICDVRAKHFELKDTQKQQRDRYSPPP
ncbi:CLUMA_CG019693, isoform A [Clunio marinus]|uniref:CLUMA_CG019693, isoform A n=1 Tax=Clunio marinus TaxID=568069 RepID=A0A1J1J250_9DIPT|nr:CLUMA_CG019693, isoform A [Clunio marinus]